MDILELKKLVNSNEILFYLKDGYIYCKNIKTEEIVIVGNYKSLVFGINGVNVIYNGQEQLITEEELNKMIISN